MSAWTDVVGGAHARPGGPDDAVDGIVPGWVVRPGSVAEVQSCVRAAAAGGFALIASGRGAHLDVGAPPRRFDVLVRLDRLARVLDHQAHDMTVTLEAGCPLALVAETLARSGQWLPLDPPRPDATTVGGVLAANLAGPLRASQGRARDLLIGIRVVGADGALVAGGGRVVKNVAGYDLPKLHVGALGTLGVIVEATFKVRPRPECEEAVVIACPTASAAADTGLAVLDGEVPPLWLEVAGPGELAEGPGHGAASVVGLGGLAEEVAAGRELVGEAARRRGLHTVLIADGAALRARLADFAVEPAAGVLRAATLPAEVGAVVETITAEARAAGVDVRCLADLASGIVRAAVAEATAVPVLVRALRPALERGGGSLVIERGGGALKAEVDVWGDPGPGVELMRNLKAAFDPTGVFAPGRFVGGL